jgi:hypothetical protein
MSESRIPTHITAGYVLEDNYCEIKLEDGMSFCFNRDHPVRQADGKYQEGAEWVEQFQSRMRTILRESGFKPKAPEVPRPKPIYELSMFPNGLVGTQWRYNSWSEPGTVTVHDGNSIELDNEWSTDCVTVEWLFEAYTLVP